MREEPEDADDAGHYCLVSGSAAGGSAAASAARTATESRRWRARGRGARGATVGARAGARVQCGGRQRSRRLSGVRDDGGTACAGARCARDGRGAREDARRRDGRGHAADGVSGREAKAMPGRPRASEWAGWIAFRINLARDVREIGDPARARDRAFLTSQDSPNSPTKSSAGSRGRTVGTSAVPSSGERMFRFVLVVTLPPRSPLTLSSHIMLLSLIHFVATHFSPRTTGHPPCSECLSNVAFGWML